MSNLHTLLSEAAGPLDATTTTVADADLVRGHRSLRKRRVGRLATSSGIAAVAAVGAFAIVSAGAPTSTGPPSASSARESVVSTALVSYTGTQPVGYTLDSIPEGWEVRDDTTSLLTLVPEGSPPGAGPADAISLEGTVAIATQKDTGVPSGVRLDPVEVDGQPAVIAHLKGGGDTRALFLELPSGSYLEIQVWDGLGWDNDQIAEFGADVHVTDDMTPVVG